MIQAIEHQQVCLSSTGADALDESPRRGEVRLARADRHDSRGHTRLAEGKPWTRREAESGGAFFTLGVHALDLARWLAGAQGEPLEGLTAGTAHRDASADFPLVAWARGRLGAIEIEAVADLRGDASFHLEIEIDAERSEGTEERGQAPKTRARLTSSTRA